MTKIFFSSDQHFGHENVVTKMGRSQFSDIKQHDDHIIDMINHHVGLRDTLCLLGDFSWKQPIEYRKAINCKHIIFVIGNHDRKQLSYQAFGHAHQYYSKKLSIVDYMVFLCHYPMAFWNKSHYGHPHLYGHTHSQKEAELDRIWPHRRSMDVGVDNAYKLLGEFRPFSESEIVDLIMHRDGHEKEFMDNIKS